MSFLACANVSGGTLSIFTVHGVKPHAMSGVVALPNILTAAPYTGVAVSTMLSLRPVTDWNSVLAQRSIVSAFNEAGFTTYWFSSQGTDVLSRPDPSGRGREAKFPRRKRPR